LNSLRKEKAQDKASKLGPLDRRELAELHFGGSLS